MLFLGAFIIFDCNQEAVSGQKFYQSLFHRGELAVHVALNKCIQHDGCFSYSSEYVYSISVQSSVYPTGAEQWAVFQVWKKQPWAYWLK